MSFLHDFPWTSEYDGDLSWLIREYKRLGENVDDLSKRVKTLEDLYASIPEEIAKATTEMQNKVNQVIAEMRLTVNTQLAEIRAYVNSEIADAKEQIAALQADVAAKIAAWQKQFDEMTAKLNELYVKLNSFVRDEIESMKLWVKGYVAHINRTWPPVMDPTDSKVEDLQTVLYHMYNYLSFGIPVYEFDALDMPVQEFDDRQIPVACFDRWGKFLFRDWSCCRMQSPFTGEIVPISDVVLRLTRLHQNGVTAGEFDSKEIVVQTFDEKEVTAYDFDWTSVWFDELTA